MQKINSAPIQRPPAQWRQTPAAAAQPPQSSETQAAELGIRTLADLELMSDDLASVLVQLRRRSEAEKRSNRATNPYAWILEEDSQEKVNSLHHIGQTTDLLAGNFLETARSLFPDDSDLVLVLRELIRRKRLRKTSGIDSLQLEEMLESVIREGNPKMCKAGINVGLKATLYSSRMEVSAKALRQSYRDFLVSDEGELPQYEQWVEQYGPGRRVQVADFIETALLHDMQSHDPSCSKPEFGMLLGQMVTLKKLQASDHAFVQSFLRSNANFLLIEPALLTAWFECLQNPFQLKREIDHARLANLSRTLILPVPALRQRLLNAIRLIDAELFLDADIRQVLLDALLDFDLPKAPDDEPVTEPAAH